MRIFAKVREIIRELIEILNKLVEQPLFIVATLNVLQEFLLEFSPGFE
jgi:hypothetical protein